MPERPVTSLEVIVDMGLCESHGQCVFAAPQVFAFDEDDVLVYSKLLTSPSTTRSSPPRQHVPCVRSASSAPPRAAHTRRPQPAITLGPHDDHAADAYRHRRCVARRAERGASPARVRTRRSHHSDRRGTLQPLRQTPLSKGFLTSDANHSSLALTDTAALGLTELYGRRAVHLDPSERTVHLDVGQSVPYDGLVIATGVGALRWPSPSPPRVSTPSAPSMTPQRCGETSARGRAASSSSAADSSGPKLRRLPQSWGTT